MDASRLWYKIAICKCLECLNERSIQLVAQFIDDELNIIITNNCNNHVTSHQDIAKQLLFNQYNQILDKNVDLLVDLWKYVKQLKLNDKNKKQKKHKQSDNYNNSTKINYKLQFTILKLPDDLIIHTSLFLDKKTIIQFERCCRILYQSTNTLSFISKSNNFQRLELHARDDNMAESSIGMKYIVNHPFDFFKFSRLIQFSIIDPWGQNFKTFRDEFKKIQKQDWFITCLKSLRKLCLGGGGSYLLDLFPLSDLQQLDYFILNFRQDNYKAQMYFPSINANEKRISINKLELCYGYYHIDGKKSRACLSKYDDNKVVDRLMKSFDIKHLHLRNLQLDISFFENLPKYHPNLTTLTLGGYIKVFGTMRYDNTDIINNKCYQNLNQTQRLPLNINTLRLRCLGKQCEVDKYSIIGNESIAELLNLDKNLQNLVLDFDVSSRKWSDYGDNSYRNSCIRLMTNILKNYYFYNLKNLNILVMDFYNHEYFHEDNFFCKEFFDILLENKQLIKNKFQQFNIGYQNKHMETNQTVYYLFSFNNCHEMTDDDIKSHKNNWYETFTYFQAQNQTDKHPLNHERGDQHLVQKYLTWQEQWMDINWCDR